MDKRKKPNSRDFIEEDSILDSEDMEEELDDDELEGEEEDDVEDEGEEVDGEEELEEDENNSDLVDRDGEEEEEDGLNAWGKDKNDYYQEKEESDSDIEDEEEIEGEARERLEGEALDEDNFFDVLAKQGEGDDDEIQVEQSFELLKEKENISEKIKSLPDEKKLLLLKQDSPELLLLLEEYKKSLKELKSKVEPILKAFSKRKFKENEGVSFLDVKSNLLLSYCINILFYLMMKIQGKPVKHHPVIQKLLYLKTLIGKLKPIEKKLEYQINKLLRISQVQPDERVDDPLLYRPKPAALSENITTENFDVDERGRIVEKRNEKNIYRAPKISAQLSKEDKLQEKKQKQLERKKKFLLRNSLLEDMADELSEKPKEEKLKDLLDQVYDKEEEERIRYEEDNFVRLPVTKNERIKLKKKMNQAFSTRADDFKDMDKMRELLKTQGLIDNEDSKERQKTNMKKTLASFSSAKEKKLFNEDQSSEDEFYKSVKNNKKEKRGKIKEEKQTQKEVLFKQMDNQEVDIDNEGRKINRKIMKNKGLIRNRKKDEGNARIQLKKKYKKAIVKLKYKGKTHRVQKGAYQGEATGIRAGVIKSVSLK